MLTDTLDKLSRRSFLQSFGTSMAGLSLSGIFAGDRVFAGATSMMANPLAPHPKHFPAKARACIFLYMYGGLNPRLTGVVPAGLIRGVLA